MGVAAASQIPEFLVMGITLGVLPLLAFPMARTTAAV